MVASILRTRGVSPEDVIALGPEPTVTEVMDSEPTVTVATFFSPAEAHASRMALIAEPACPACGSRNVAPEAWVDESESDRQRRRGTRRKWHYVCGDCREAWPQ